MHQKKRKRIVIGVLVAFFMFSGLWYYVMQFRSGAETGRLKADTKTMQEGKTPETEKAAQDAERLESGDISVPEPSLYVFLCGCIEKEGVYSLCFGSRLYEAVELAGGFTKEADQTYHNLARMVVDGERIYIPSKAETEEFAFTERVNGSEPNQGKDAKTSEKGKINLNTATREELMSLTGIGEAKAEDIIEYRIKAGAFAAIEEIMNVSGIGTAMFEKIKEYITVK